MCVPLTLHGVENLRRNEWTKFSLPSEYDMLRSVMMVARITTPNSHLQRSSSMKTDAASQHEMTDSIVISETFDADTPTIEKSTRAVLVTVSNEELDDVMLVFDRHYDKENTLDALMQKCCVQLGSRATRTL